MCKTERDQEIARLYTSGRSAPALARSFSLSVPTIRAIVKEQGARREPRAKQEGAEEKKKRQPPKVRETLSRAHERLGEALGAFRALEMKQTRREAAERLGWTAHKVSAIEAGHTEVSLTDLLDLMGYMKRPIQDLIKP
jgi:transposase